MATDVQRLVYSPKAWVFVKNVHEEILDLTEFVVAGEVRRLINQVSTAEIKLRNPEMIFTTRPGQPAAFHPMDPITIYLERITGHPVQVFTGYLDSTPYLQLFPGTITLKASCTLKRLLHNYFNKAQQYTLNFFHHFGWNASADGVLGPTQGGEVESKHEEDEKAKWEKEEKAGTLKKKQVEAKEKAQATKRKKTEKEFNEFNSEGIKKIKGAVPFSSFPGAKVGNDGSFSKILWALLYYVSDWKDENIYIEAMPPTVPALIQTLWTNFENSENKAAKEDLINFWTALIGSGAQGTGGVGGTTPSSGNIHDTGKVVQKMAEIANHYNVPPEFVICTSLCECGFNQSSINGTNSSNATGWFQFTSSEPYGSLVKVNYPTDARDTAKATDAFCKAVVARGPLPAHESDWNKFSFINIQGAGPPGVGYGNWETEMKQAKAYLSQYVTHRVFTNPSGQAHGTQSEPEENQRGSSEESGKTGTSSESWSQYHNPFEKCKGKVTGLRIDQGADYLTESGEPIVAIADQQFVTEVAGWDGGALYAFQVTQSGPLHNQIIYYAEGLVPVQALKEKKKTHFKAGEVFATTDYSFTPTPCLEFGYCDRNGNPLSHTEATHLSPPPEDIGAHPTKIGAMFGRMAQKLGAPQNPGNPGTGPLVPNGPTETVTGEPTSGGEEGNISTAATAASFLSNIQYPTVEELAEAMIIGGQKSLMNAMPVMNMVQQVCEASLRSFQSLPNGDFYGFYPDYFGEFGNREPYWQIDNIEILSGEIELTDENLATHVFAIGNTAWPADVPIVNEINAGVMTIFEAFTPGVLFGKEKTTSAQDRQSEAIAFLQRYGARKLEYEAPTVYSTLFEQLLSYQQFLLAWARQFKSVFTFTFMPELYPGGKVAFPDHGIQMYIESVTHSWDLQDGFHTVCELEAPSVFRNKENSAAVAELPENMVAALLEPQRKQVSKAPTAPKQHPALPKKTNKREARQFVGK